jgi:hypothetical protein
MTSTVTVPVSEATSLQLDWLVATLERLGVYIPAYADHPWLAIRSETGIYRCPSYSADWAHGGPIIEREYIELHTYSANDDGIITWRANDYMDGPTPLIAAMRCFVASRLGDEVEVPREISGTAS